MHRTVNVRHHENEVCGSQRGKAKIVAYMVRGNSYKEQPDRINPARLKESYIKVFSSSRGAKPRTPRRKAEYDFAAVDFREKLCYPTPPKKQIRRNFFSIFRFNTLILCIVLIPYLIYNNTSHAFKRNYICTRYRQNFYNIVLYILNRICFFRCKSAFLCNSFMFE